MADHGQLKVKRDIDSVDDDPLLELTRIMGLAPEAKSETQQLDDFGIDLEQELLGAFDAGEPADGRIDRSEAPVDTGHASVAPVSVVQPDVQSAREGDVDPLDHALDEEFSSMLENELTVDGLMPADGGAPVAQEPPFDAAPLHDHPASEDPAELMPAGDEFLDLDLDFDAGSNSSEADSLRETAALPVSDAEQPVSTGSAQAQAGEAAELPLPSLEDELAALLGSKWSGPTQGPSPAQPDPVQMDNSADPDHAVADEEALQNDGHTPQSTFRSVDDSNFEPEVAADQAYVDEAYPREEMQSPSETFLAAPYEQPEQRDDYRMTEAVEDNHAAGMQFDEYEAAAVSDEPAAPSEPVAGPEQPQAHDPFAELAAMAAATASRASIGYGSLTSKLKEEAREPASDAPAATSVAAHTDDMPQDQWDSHDLQALDELASADSSVPSEEVEMPAMQEQAAYDVPDAVSPASDAFLTDTNHNGAAFGQEPEPSEVAPVFGRDWRGSDGVFGQPESDGDPAMSDEDRSSAAEQLDGDASTAKASWNEYIPELETVDVPEGKVELTDELDLPEIAYRDETPPPAADDELELQLASVFDDPQALEAATPPQAAPASMRETAEGAFVSADLQGEHVAAPAARGNIQQDDPAHADVDLGDDWLAADLDDFAIDTSEFDGTSPEQMPPPVAPARNPAGQRRGLVVAGLVAGVAIIGGIAAYAFSSGGDGGSDGAPVLVKADPEPVKVRPEQPGGVTVPNQDKMVYDRVAGSAQETLTQERLVSSGEEPVDLAARAASPTPSEPSESSQLPGSGKSEDRIVPNEAAATPARAEEVAAVAPRVVRTMVVKPDGTLVPREELAAPAASAPQTAAQAMATDEATPASPTPTNETPDRAPAANDTAATAAAAADQPAAASSSDGAATAGSAEPSTPNTVPVVPSRPSDQPVEIVGEAVQVAAANPGGWSMQIASQPTAEGAQASYANLSQRYASVLDGRGVNIVKAEIEGKGTYYRVRIPAQSRDEAVELCERYKSAGGNCFVAR